MYRFVQTAIDEILKNHSEIYMEVLSFKEHTI